MARNGAANYRAFARADRLHETLAYNLDGARIAKRPTPRPLPPVADLQRDLAAHQDAFVELAQRTAVFGASPDEIKQLEALRRDIGLLERDLREANSSKSEAFASRDLTLKEHANDG